MQVDGKQENQSVFPFQEITTVAVKHALDICVKNYCLGFDQQEKNNETLQLCVETLLKIEEGTLLTKFHGIHWKLFAQVAKLDGFASEKLIEYWQKTVLTPRGDLAIESFPEIKADGVVQFAGLNQSIYLIYQLFFLVAQYATAVKKEEQYFQDLHLPQSLWQQFLENEIQLVAQAYVWLITYQAYFPEGDPPEPEDQKESRHKIELFADEIINCFITQAQSLVSTAKIYERLLPCGSQEHAVYLVFLYARETQEFSLALDNSFATISKQVQRKVITTFSIKDKQHLMLAKIYVAAICKAKHQENQEQAELILLNTNARLNLPAAIAPNDYPWLDAQQVPNCSVEGYRLGLWYRLQTLAAVRQHPKGRDFIFRWFFKKELQFTVQTHQPQGLFAQSFEENKSNSLVTKSAQENWPLREVLYRTETNHLLPTALNSLYSQFIHRSEQLELKQALHYYVQPDGQFTLNDERFKLWPYLEQNLKQAQAHYLVQGDAGSGKSVFAHRLEKAGWAAFDPDDILSIVPVLIELKNIPVLATTNGADWIEYILREQFKYSDTQSGKNLIYELRQRYRFLFILDGFDEKPGEPCDLLTSVSHWQAQVLITARSQYLQELIKQKVHYLPKYFPQTKELIIAPFDKTQIDTYLKKYADSKPRSDNPEWSDVKTYNIALDHLPEVRQLIENPLLLRMVVEVLPELQNKARSIDAITRADVYEAFIDSWFEREIIKRAKNDESFEQKEARKAGFHDYAERLAFKMFSFNKEGKAIDSIKYLPIDEQGNSAKQTFSAEQQRDHERRQKKRAAYMAPSSTPQSRLTEWDEFFQLDDSQLNSTEQVLRKAQHASCPLRCLNGHTYSFYHKSFLEYFTATYLFKALRLIDPIIEDIDTVIDALVNNKMPMIALNYKSLLIEPAIATFLAQKVGKHSMRTAMLVGIVQESAEDKAKHLSQAAANALTVLNYAGFQFTDLDLSHVRVSGADLSEANLDETDFSNANLDNVRFDRAWLRNADLSGAHLKNIVLGERPISKYENSISAIAYESTGTYRAVAVGNTIIIEHLMTGKNQILKSHTDNVTSISWSPQGKLASGSYDGTVIVWNPQEAKPHLILKNHEDGITSISWSYQGKLASSSSNKIIIWNLKKREPYLILHHTNGHVDGVTSISWSARGRLASSSLDKIIIWNLEKAKPRQILRGHTDTVTSVSWSSEGELASGSSDSTIIVWDLEKAKPCQILRGHTNAVTSVSWSSKGELASGSLDKTVIIWDLQCAKSRLTLESHADTVTNVCWSFKDDLVSGSSDMTVIIWDLQQAISRFTLQGHKEPVNSISWNSKGELASSSSDKTIIVWDLQLNQPRLTLQGHKSNVNSVSWSAKGELASGSSDKTVIVWDLQQNQPRLTLRGHRDIVTSISWSAQGELASGDWNNTVIVWNLDRAKPRMILQIHTNSVTSISWGSKGRLASGSWDNTVVVWDLNVLEQLSKKFKGSSPYLDTFASILWKRRQIDSSQILKGHTSTVNSVCWGPQGVLASGSSDNTVIVWNLQQAIPGLILQGHHSAVTSVSWSADGELASSSYDGTVIIWNLKKRQPAFCLKGYLGTINDVAWNWQTNQSDLLASGDRSGTVKVWQRKKSASQTKWHLFWNSHKYPRLFAESCQLNNADGLSHEQIMLFKQKEAKGKPYSPTQQRLSQSNFLNICGLNYQPIPGDGHCLFHAVGLYLNETQDWLRRFAAMQLENHQDKFECFIPLLDGKSIKDYIEAIRNENEWASHIEIEALMQVFQRPILVIESNGKITNREDAYRFEGKPIFVYYNGHNHYDALLLDGTINSNEIVDNLLSQDEVQNTSLIKNDRM